MYIYHVNSQARFIDFLWKKSEWLVFKYEYGLPVTAVHQIAVKSFFLISPLIVIVFLLQKRFLARVKKKFP